MTELTFAVAGSRQAEGEVTPNPCPGKVKERGTHQVYSGSSSLVSVSGVRRNLSCLTLPTQPESRPEFL